ncbi:hypothetical protein Esti_006653 [Eimeria stiedai]
MRGVGKASEGLAPAPPEPPGGSQQEHLHRPGRQSMCTITVTPVSPSVSPSVLRLRRGQAQNYLSFLAVTTSAPQTLTEAKGNVLQMGRPAQPGNRCSKDRGGTALPRQSGLHGSEPSGAPNTPSDETAAGSGAPMQRLPKNRRAPPPTPSEDANRRVRFWWSRGTRQAAAAGAGAAATAAAGAAAATEGPQQEPAGLHTPQRPTCLAQAAAALGSSSVPQGKRAKVTFAPQGFRIPLSARRACSSCIKTRTQQQQPTGEAASAVAAAGASASSGATSGGPSLATARLLLPNSSLGGIVSESAARRAPPARPPPSRPHQLQQPLLLQKQLRDEELPTMGFPSSQPRDGRQGLPPTSLDASVEPLAAEGASLAATRAAAVAKAAAAVAAAAQAEVEAAAAAAAAWGGTGEYKASSSGLSTEQRREQLMLVLRLLLLLPPELQHAVQARLFMLQQQRQRLSPTGGSTWSKRAATTTNLHMTLSASGSLKTPRPKPPQPQRRDGEAAAASAALPGGLSTDLQKSSSSHSSNSSHSNSSSHSSSSGSNSSTSRTISTIISPGIQQQHDEQHAHLQHSARDSTVNGLFMSATLQASAVLQLTPGRLTTDAAAAGALAGGSTAHISASGRLPSCRCRSCAAARHRPLISLPSHGRSPPLQQQQQQHAQLVFHPSAGDHYAGCLLGSQQQHQEGQPPEGRAVVGRSNVGSPPQASICRVHLASIKPKAQAPWMVEGVPSGASSTGPPLGVLGGCMRCGGAAAASSGASCGCTNNRAGASTQAGCMLPHANAASTSSWAPQRRGSQLPCCPPSASQSTALKTGGPAVAAAVAAADCCRGIVKNPSVARSSTAAQVQQQAVRDKEAAAAASSFVAGSSHTNTCSCSDSASAASAWDLRKLRGFGGQQQGSRQDASSLQPAHVVGLNFRRCSSGCISSGSRRRWNQDLLQLRLASLPSLLRVESTGELRNTAAELRALTASHARLMIASRSIDRGPPQRAFAITVHTSASNTANTESSYTATSNSLSDTSCSKEAGEVTVLCEEEADGPPSRYSQREQKRDSSDLDEGAAAAAASALSQVWVEHVEGEEGTHPRMALPVGFEGPPSLPEAESFSSLGGCSSPALTLEARSSCRLRRAESLGDVKQVGGEEVEGWTTAAWRGGLRPTPASEDLHASFMYGFPPLPEANNLSSSTSLRGPTSLFFCANDPRGYKGPLVRSAAVISVGTLSASAVRLPSKAGNPVTFSPGSACGKAVPQEPGPGPMLHLKVVSVSGSISSQTEGALYLQEQQQRHPSSCPNLQHNTEQRTSPAEKLLGGVVCSVAWRRTDVTDILDFKGKAGGALLPLSCLQASSRFRSHKSFCHSTSMHDSKVSGPLFTNEPLQCASPPDLLSDFEDASPTAAAFDNSSALTRSPFAEDEDALLLERLDSKGKEGLLGGGAHEESAALVAEAASEVPASPRTSGDRAATTEASLQRAGPLVEAMTTALECSKRRSLSLTAGRRMPLGGSESPRRSTATTAMKKGAVWVPGSRCISSHLSAASEAACSAEPDARDASLGRQEDPLSCAPRRASSQSTEGKVRRPLRKQQRFTGSETEEEAERELLTPSRLFASLGLDTEHSLQGGLGEVLQAAARAQQDLSAKHEEELQALRAAAAQVEADPASFPRVLSLYIEALQRRCHCAMQRTLKAKRAAASLQLADEERVQLLRRFRSELVRTCRARASVQTECSSTNDKSGAMSSTQSLANDALVAASLAGPNTELSGAPSTLLKKSEGSSALTSAAAELSLPTIPEFLLLHHDESGLNKQIGPLRRLGSAPRLALRGGQDCAEPTFLRSIRNATRSSSAATGCTAGPRGNVRLTGNPLEDFSANQQLVSAFLNQFASWQFESAPEFKSEESFLKQLQKDFAASSSNGSAVTLEQFLVEQREAALRELPREMATPEGIRKLLHPIAKHVTETLKPPVSMLQQHATQSVDLSLGSSVALFHVKGPCVTEQVASWRETLRANVSGGTHASGVSEVEPTAQRECQFTRAFSNCWRESLQELETMMEDEVDALTRLCSDSIENVKQTFERIMPVKVVHFHGIHFICFSDALPHADTDTNPLLAPTDLHRQVNVWI